MDSLIAALFGKSCGLNFTPFPVPALPCGCFCILWAPASFPAHDFFDGFLKSPLLPHSRVCYAS
jgi:hypothetical protein